MELLKDLITKQIDKAIHNIKIIENSELLTFSTNGVSNVCFINNDLEQDELEIEIEFDIVKQALLNYYSKLIEESNIVLNDIKTKESVVNEKI